MNFDTLDDLRAACRDLPEGDRASAEAAAERQGRLTKPPGSLGRLEELAIWLARWQGRPIPRLDKVEIVVFAGNHGIAARGVSAFPIDVTRQMVANYAAGGAGINKLAEEADAALRVVPLDLDRPTGDFTQGVAMDDADFLAAVTAGYEAVDPETDLFAVGEMGIGNTTAAAALCAALLGGGGSRWVGRGTGIDEAGLARKRSVVDAGLARHEKLVADPLRIAAALGGRELAAMMGATLAARHHGVPMLLDGFVATAAVLPLSRVNADALAHCRAAHVSAEPGHRAALNALGLVPLLDIGMRLGEGTGAAVAMLLARAALACHAGMATFDEAGVAEKTV
ncbi:Nicotinate-nucleotide--dimethylbenzimidazole phosphoribosyltransferase [Rhodovulum sp. PH10]|uniref:nicotinate-nucleotide--dimethylbenzimidazole phosphoribosyltransferase n=1 Tax=Rhodovulum sp. PH10 TaxID=1187851 RepID=UPI00027C2C9F|nr:nicotinate-nucleotide--dimethylbenzimidazole phosphoribosyltransferase [Rhodovulum sp. PH10]EJW09978.1 Nicotinate-nucleotide--dimethylbenzimidazole phosphoribosyltransferase [Rhodovulum sp. PH10]